MINCRQITEQASEYLDKDHSFFKRVSFKMHLMLCNHCQRYIHQLQTTIKAAKGLDEKRISDDEARNLTKKIINSNNDES
jgi:hypothetical protein